MPYLFFALIAFALTLFLTLLVKKMAWRLKIVDEPVGERKLHRGPIPLLGGVAIFLGFWLVVAAVRTCTPGLEKNLSLGQLLALFGGSAILMFGGYLDDKYNLKPKFQIIFPLLAALLILLGGVNLKEITNPFGGVIALDFLRWGHFLPLVWLLVFFWLMGLMYTTKLLDGLDGLAAGLTAIGGLMIFFLALMPRFYQPDVALLALIFSGANLGFLVFNFHPAKIFLGEGGSLMIGYILGTLAIVAGGKIATTLLVMGIAALDVLMVAVRRWRRHQPFWQADAGHLHHRLLALGFSQRQVVLFFYGMAIGFGLLTLFLQSRQKLVALSVLIGIGIIVSVLAGFLSKNRRT